MTHVLMGLPFAADALEPYLSKETLQYHHGKHHATYVNNLNKLIIGTPFEQMSLESIIISATGAIFNNAAQVFNHDFYFSGLKNATTLPSDELIALFERDFGSTEAFKESFMGTALALFGSGWVWLSINSAGKLILEQHSNASNPLLAGYTPLLTCDVWEHAYYIDYRNARADYLEKWWTLVNWELVSNKLTALQP